MNKKKELVGVCGMNPIYKWLPSIEKGEQIVGGSKLEDGKIVPPEIGTKEFERQKLVLKSKLEKIEKLNKEKK